MASLAELIGTSPGIAGVREQVQRLARQVGSRRQPPILIEGETGTGKGLVARLIHACGPRGARPFVDVNCAAIPETLIESELFGYERGAFTDARQAKPGLFQLAHSGTIFLDEIGLLPEAVQAKLLKVIEERAVRRLGATRGEPVDIAILSATNEDLAAAVNERRFRADLYHRLAVLRLALPALRERGDDVLLLADHYLAAVSRDYGLPAQSFTPDARTALQNYSWPGNVRELRNVIERTALIAEAPRITAAMLGLPEGPSRPGPDAARAASTRPDAALVPTPSASAPLQERAALEHALRETAWNVSRAAERLGITRNAIRYRIEKYGLEPHTGSPRRAGRPTAAPAPAAPAPPPVPAEAAPARELRRLTFLRARFATRADSEVVTAGRIDETLLDKIAMFGGTPTALSGGDVGAVFGLTPAEDAPRRAASAAMAALREVARDETGSVTALIHAASVPVQRRGAETTVEAGAAEDIASGLDALMRELPRPGVFVTEATTAFLQRHFDLARVTPNLSRLVGPERARPGDGGSGRQVAFVGRQQELQFLTARLAAAARGHGEVVGVAGAAGLGKSRLLFELRQALRGSGATVLEGHCVSHGAAMAYLPIREVVRGALGLTEEDEPRAAERAIRAGLSDLGLPEAESTPLLLHFLGLADAEPTLSALDPDRVKARTFEVVRGLLLAMSRRQPLVIALEDLHWTDRTSEELLAALADSVAGAPVLLVTTYRPGYHPAWMGRSYATQIALQPLTPGDGALVVRSLLGEHADESVVQMILERAEGNPFFLEELAREVREQGGHPTASPVPETVEAVLMARIDRLPAGDRSLLQAAAVIGRTVPAFLLSAVTGLDEEERRAGLRRLRAAEFLYEQAVGDEVAHVFSHALTQEVAYQSLAPDLRCRFHGRIAEVLEGLDPVRQVQHVERLAYHCLRGRLWSKAVTYSRQAGHRALARSAYRESAQCFEHALEALRGLPENHDALELGVDLRCELRTVLLPLGRHERILNELHTAQGLAERLGDKTRLARIVAYLADGLRLRGDHERALDCGQRALALAHDHGDLALQVAVNNYLGQICYDLGQYARASRFLAANVERLVGPLSQDRLGLPFLSSVHSRTWLVLCLSELGEFAEARQRAQEAVELARAADHPFSLTSAFAGLGRVHLRQGRLDAAVPALETSLELCRRWGIGLWAPILGSVLGYAYALQGRLREGIPLLEQGVEQQERIKQLTGHALRMATLGEAYLLDGQTAAARALAPRVLALAREQKERGHEAYALRLVALAAPDDEPGSAEAHWEQAIALATALGMRPLRARCLLDLGRLQARRGQGQTAADTLRAAVALLREMDMGVWLEEGEAAVRGPGPA